MTVKAMSQNWMKTMKMTLTMTIRKNLQCNLRLATNFWPSTNYWTLFTVTHHHKTASTSGPKDNMFIVIDREDNINVRQNGKQGQHRDDCGVWNGRHLGHVRQNSCKNRFHRKSSGLKSARLWNKFSAENMQWLCKSCVNQVDNKYLKSFYHSHFIDTWIQRNMF